ncbi:TIGR02186 family protein, partial [Vibrio parahaemolyticus]
SRDVVVRRKHRVAGIWLNDTGLTLSGVPGFYAVFSSRPLGQLMSPSLRTLEGVGVDTLAFSAADATDRDEIETGRAALIAAFARRGL